ncbi:MAG: HTH-type transcriptional repressor KstR2 [Pelotomaculum sp. PtaB.Bin013]|uniref:TetR/AcrR family transcriptional regulator n=1 Tax=Pelotomaculum isophthalicicum JI TaxID=947010 RepID=A0A9X4H0J0_9FIRM|nr:TetR/AcrR family transcriptional regulator [Pelotomaculum isophthalicicum]MDF9409877.1 TetR/AcrR family transcriptional regulator [Pelotomaculum isophthalicicum JI]OPX82775.1 MAG: HTH-type transcriptional repressor KstR2 [Pelotomaculum sp. PtaB.Bin013]
MDQEKNLIYEDLSGLNKRDEIIRVAAKLFRNLGYIETSMKDIADRVGILKGSLYYHFSSKEELLNEVINKGIDLLLVIAQQVYKQYEQNPQERLKQLVKLHLLHLTNNNEYLVIATNQTDKLTLEHRENYIVKRDLYESLLRETLEEGIRADQFPPLDIKLTILAILGMCNWIVQWYKHDGPYSAEYITDYLSTLICDRMLAK